MTLLTMLKLRDWSRSLFNVDIYFIQIFEYVAYKDANGITLEPFYSEDCILYYNNVEAYRSEVNLLFAIILIGTKFYFQEFQRLQDGSMQYFQVDTTLYRVCIQAAKNSGH